MIKNDLYKTAICIGKFDAMHIGHDKLFKKTIEISKKYNLSPLLYVIGSSFSLISKEDLIFKAKKIGFEKVVIKELTNDFKSMTKEEFFDKCLKEELNAKAVIVGYNFRFGKERYADAIDLKELCEKNDVLSFIVDEVRAKDSFGKIKTVSSTTIRNYLEDGDVKSANSFLGYNYYIKGKITHGKKIGTSLGFPTANIADYDMKMILKNGVYATKTTIDSKTYLSITNVGKKPTVKNDDVVNTETFIIDFKGDIYEEEIKVEFIKKIRDEIKFESLEDLKYQISKDVLYVKEECEF